MPRLLIIDGHSYAYRAFFAIRRLTSPEGDATNAIYGFIRMLGKIRATVRPTHIVVIWDGGLAPERMTLLPEYKAQRVEMPADLRPQLNQITVYLGAANIASYVKRDVEADDCIAALACRAVKEGMEVVIASSDKDFMQLVEQRVRLLNPNDKSETLWDAEQVRRKTGVEPSQIVDWLSLVGDTVDNIPGVSGVGPKTAADLLRQFGSVDELYRRLPEIRAERLRAVLAESEQTVRRNQKLVRLDIKAECELPLDTMVSRLGDIPVLRRLFEQWGFKTLVEEIEKSELNNDLFANA